MSLSFNDVFYYFINFFNSNKGNTMSNTVNTSSNTTNTTVVIKPTVVENTTPKSLTIGNTIIKPEPKPTINVPEGYKFTEAVLHEIAPYGRNLKIREDLIDPLNKWLPYYQINTLFRISNFIGQAAEESDSFNTLQEYASGEAYEGRRDLGNIYPGDGRRYKGRGIFQLTGRANYKRYGEILGLDLVDHPEIAETADVAVQVACEYWKTHGLNELADRNATMEITRRINGGLNGLSQRELFTHRAYNLIHPFFK